MIKTQKKFCIIAILLTLVSAVSFSQATRKTTTQIDAYILAVKQETEKPDISKLLNNTKKHNDILLAVQKHYTDSVYYGALEAYRLTYTIANKNTVSETRQKAVEALCAGIRNSQPSIGGWCVNHLSVFTREDFNAKAKATINNALQTGTPKLDELIKVAGYLQLNETKPKLEILAQGSGNVSQKWAVWLALARMGEQPYINNVVATIKKQGLNDDVVYELIPDLIYTRSKEAIALTLEMLFNEKKKCYSSAPDNPVKIECGYRIMEYLAPVIKEFPYAIKASGDIDTDNYETALTEVRKWFTEKGDNYEILDVMY